jgi:thioredoxin 1
MSVTHIQTDKFQTEVLDQKGVVLVDFYAEWCGPCKMTAPILDQLSDEKKDIKFVKVDVDKNPDLASQYSVFSIPTFVVVKDGKVVHQFSGAMGKEGFEQELNKIL